MRDVNRHDVREALYQAPGEQISELGDAVARFRAKVEVRCPGDPFLPRDVDQQLQFFEERLREIEALVEFLHECVEDADMASMKDHGPMLEARSEPTAFAAKVQPPFAAALLYRLAAAREAGDLSRAAGTRDTLTIYAWDSLIPGVREAVVNGMRLDALAHGETKSGNYIAPLEHLREELLSLVPDKEAR